MSADDASAALSEIRTTLLVLGTRGDAGPHFMVANWATQVSFDPWRFVAALKKSSHTLQNVQARGAFTVNLVRADEAGASLAKEVLKRKGDGMQAEEGPLAPRLAGAYAGFDCRMLQALDVGGDHFLAVADVVDGWKRGDGPALTLADLHFSYGG
jgi:flavin reductase (DIM6/NTAB) family NADH-FMN oxidoreductase RutF